MNPIDTPFDFSPGCTTFVQGQRRSSPGSPGKEEKRHVGHRGICGTVAARSAKGAGTATSIGGTACTAKDSRVVARTAAFDLPCEAPVATATTAFRRATRVYTCFTSDFFLAEADEWRSEAWDMIRERSDLSFVIPTKRIDRFGVALPADWGDGYPHVAIACTIENQEQLDRRLPIFKALPIRHRLLFCAPLLGPLDFHGLARPRHRRGVGRRRVGQPRRGCATTTGCSIFADNVSSRESRSIFIRRVPCLRKARSPLPHSPRVPAHAGTSCRHRL